MATYPWSGYSADTLARQREINVQAVMLGKCPPLVEDGILGPSTCGAGAAYASQLPAVAAMSASCKSFNAAAASACAVIPWNVKHGTALSLQIGLNTKLPGLGYAKIAEDGVLGPNTCAAAGTVLGQTAAVGLGCKSFGTLVKVAAPASPDTPVQVPNTTYVPTTPPVVTTAPPKSPDTPAPVNTTPSPSAPTTSVTQASAAPKKTNWLLWGAVAAGALVGGYFLTQGDKTKTVLTTTTKR